MNKIPMAMSCMIRRASTIMSASMNNAISSGARHFCTDSKKKLLNQKLLTTLKSEIKLEEQRLINKYVPPVPPPNFPFTIEDDPCNRYQIALKRDFNGEKIELVVKFNYECYEFGRGDEEEEEEEEIASTGIINSNKEEKLVANHHPPHVEVDVKISKKSGRNIKIQASVDADDIGPHTMMVAEESAAKVLGEYCVGFVEEEDELPTDLRKYLEMRGLDKSCGEFVCNYMLTRSKRRPLLVLQKMKNFLEASN